MTDTTDCGTKSARDNDCFASPLLHWEGNPMATKEECEKHARRLEHPDKLLEACAAAREQMPVPRVVADCGSADLRVAQSGAGRGHIWVDLISFKGPITNVEFVGEWVKAWPLPPSGGFFTNSNTKIFGLGTTHVVLGATIAPGAGNIFAQLTYLEAITPTADCVGLLPSGGATFI